MKKKMRFLAIMILTLSINCIYGESGFPHYFNKGEVKEMMQKAGSEGKLFFIDFYADWCTPCKWMDQTVFSDKEVEQMLTENYIPIKVNIDDIEGFELKQKYKVAVLPTIMVFNSKGQVVERVEETMNVDELLKMLSLHNNPNNKVKIKHDFNVAPGGAKDQFAKREMTQAYLRYIESESRQNKNYRLQMGMFYDYQSAFDKVESLKRTFLEPIIVVNDIKDEKVRFKVMMGEFQTMSEAESFQKILHDDFSIESIIN